MWSLIKGELYQQRMKFKLSDLMPEYIPIKQDSRHIDEAIRENTIDGLISQLKRLERNTDDLRLSQIINECVKKVEKER